MIACREVSRRDVLAWRVCNWVMRHVATPWYRDMIDGCIRYGMEAAALDAIRDSKDGK